MTLDATKLKELRELTGVSFSLCKKALDESGNDIEKAKKLLNEWGIEKAASKDGRETKEGAIFSYIHHNKKIGVLVELLCETDFVAKNSDFETLGKHIASQIAFLNPKDAAILLKSESVREPGKTIDVLIKESILKIGENIILGRFTRYEI
ncbi:translation elongation factor Ts [Candidatus Roizmanbacteria bacterium RIFCSPHIGHO2_02_FULL_40_13b]|uniref:Elongation factor Ts n=1 Tax=Candidatus Roizmanbacteria bacterium RIFCSPHIGHO2_01_FULL_39_24 TaxID=1802032 RepID=A0A1F7GIM4_9BACT|nr:MAG: translation elongation factor Ts [Candidatus Roizmanbacteria bacterium RIFCSPHIGHO2_01_FULL_39_24]OGK26508.1 MAG: translation elongation factor Ts [Candidatus Roizmanbacteria bacterium RIFCSPHIGHO2_02_FULL_40_13b]OGK50358.1 MAG: translation elongation factor Ts [Candidatus Roizmanbacteria bacterium RIFCSPLOWO2_01_FULL_40_32]OGK56202.1 MAG: translation elongation factor Ts [Candidatus Roizmanbacteria bacterium RIFCSPLOWO2_02_FULL_39_8]